MMKINRIPLYIIASILFGLKTFLVYWFIFDFSINNIMQAILLLLNPFISTFAFFGLSIWMKGKYQKLFICTGAFIGTIIILANMMFYRDYTDFITIPMMLQGNNTGDITISIFTLFNGTDPLLFIDVLLIIFISLTHKTTNYVRKKQISILVISSIALLANLLLAEVARPQLYLNTFNREAIVKTTGLFNYHLYDIGLQTLTASQSVFTDKTEMVEIKEYIENNVKSKEQSELFGSAKGRNLIFISLESTQNFVINNKVNGEEITPFINDLVKNSYYFENFYHQVSQGKTSDSEFLVDNSLYPLPRGAAFFVRAQNSYHAMPEVLDEQGYYSAVFHANDKRFWNRNIMYDAMGYENFFDEESFEITESNSIGWGLKDKAFFAQSIKYLEELPQPFYSKFITLTNHHPYELDKKDTSIEPYRSESVIVNQYFQTVRYTDEALQQFFKQLKQAGLYKNSVIVLMGDHYGISEYEHEALGQYLGEEINDYEHIQLQRVPFFIHIPGQEGKVISKIAGQIDVKPTLLHLLGVDTRHDINFGTDLFSEMKKNFIAFRDGSFVSNRYVYTENTCYQRATGRIVDKDIYDENHSVCEPIKEQVRKKLNYSYDIVYGDLLRFYDFE